MLRVQPSKKFRSSNLFLLLFVCGNVMPPGPQPILCIIDVSQVLPISSWLGLRPKKGVQLELFLSTFHWRCVFPYLIFFVLVSFVSSAPRILHYWWPGFVVNIGAGTRQGKGKDIGTWGPTVTTYLPPAVAGPSPLCLNPENCHFQPLPPGNIWFPQCNIFHSCWWHIQ